MKHVAKTNTALSATEQRALRKLIDKEGEVGASKRLSVSRGAMLRALAGLPVRRGTVAVIRQSLKA